MDSEHGAKSTGGPRTLELIGSKKAFGLSAAPKSSEIVEAFIMSVLTS